MSNFKNVHTEFIQRTLNVLEQYENDMKQYCLDEQYNHTLTINCMLGLVVLLKEKIITFLPNESLNEELKNHIGIHGATINNRITDLQTLVKELRHSVSHFDVDFKSIDERNQIDKIVFRNRQKLPDDFVASFLLDELLAFLKYSANTVLNTYYQYGDRLKKL